MIKLSATQKHNWMGQFNCGLNAVLFKQELVYKYMDIAVTSQNETNDKKCCCNIQQRY